MRATRAALFGVVCAAASEPSRSLRHVQRHATASGHVRVPGGRLVHESCVHEVPSGTIVGEDGGDFVFTLPAGPVVRVPQCQANATSRVSHGIAWKAWAQFKTPGSTEVTSLSSTWVVPEDPASKGNQILYYWDGIEDGDFNGGKGVLQPVLEWRLSSGWGIKSWYVGEGGTVTSNLVAVKTGDRILGTLVKDGAAWTCTGQVNGGEPATLKFTRPMIFTYAYKVLEAYGVDAQCDKYDQSGGVTFRDTAVSFDGEDASRRVQWVPASCPTGPACQGTTECEEKATVSGNDVTISYRTGSLA